MSAPVITKISSTEEKVNTKGITITGTDLDGDNFSLKFYDNDTFSPYDITKCVTYKSYNEVRFTVPTFVAGTYYIVISNSKGTSNVF